MVEATLVTTAEMMASPAGILIDARLEDDYAAGHLPGALNNCVFEVAFLERMAGNAPDKASTVMVYGAGPDSHEARMAADKLLRAGYTDVREFRDGIEGWVAAGNPIEGSNDGPNPPVPPTGRFEIDLDESRLEWLGRNLLNKHWGTAPIRAGHLEIRGDLVTGGEFVIDLTELKCSDLQDSDLHDVLIGHLQSDDFFDTALHPEAIYRITGSHPIEDAAPGLPNLRIQGELTLKGVTSPLTLDAAAGLTPDSLPAAQATFALDRTQWNVIYGSARFFKRLGGHLVNDLIEFQARIVTKG